MTAACWNAIWLSQQWTRPDTCCQHAAESNGDAVGMVDVIDEHPRDRVPWIGLVQLRAGVQHRGYRQEIAGALNQWARDREVTAVRVAVDVLNVSAVRFCTRLGFREVDRRTRSSPSGPVEVLVLELPLWAEQTHS
jgi:RimJ/RimL family protein N-acetyltransferase